MKTCFIVLGDLHIHDNQFIKRDVVKALSLKLNEYKEGIDSIGVIISGDLAFSGKTNEYKKVGVFLGMLNQEIKAVMSLQKLVPIYMVPGNHDCNFEGKSRNREEILQVLQNITEEDLISETKKFDGFYLIAKFNKCFNVDLVRDTKHHKTGFESTQINLLNSELFSTLNDKNGDDDKGIHYFPEHEIFKLSKHRSSKYSITVMHRSPDWFEYNSMNKLKNKIYGNSNILIYGHDHIQDSMKTIRKENDLFIVNPGKFDFKDNDYSFSLILIDSSDETCSITNYRWDNEHLIFSKLYELSDDIVEIDTMGLRPIGDFTSDFYKLDGNNIKDVYIFPDLDKVDDNKNVSPIKTIDELFGDIKTCDSIFIEGNANFGKTALCKNIYITSFYNKLIPLYLNMECINNKKIDRIIREAFEEQYGYEKADYEKFIQTSKNEKIIIVDNLDKINDNLKDCFCDKIATEFGHAVYTYRPNDNGNIIEITKNNMSTTGQLKYRILPFYLKKRKDLIEKLLLLSPSQSQKTNDKVEEINKFITNQIKIFSIDPSFITKYVECYVKQNSIDDFQTNIFNIVFESNITVSLQKYVSHEDIQEYFAVLEMIAHSAHFSKKSPFTIDDINRVIKNYNEEYLMKIDPSKFREAVVKANILENLGNDEYKFSKDSLLAYFTARAINKKYNSENEKEDLEWICNNLCFNINGDILLFLSYMNRNKKILDFIYSNAVQVINHWDELDLDNTKISFLNRNVAIEKLSAPTPQEKEKNEQILEEQEKRVIRNLEIKTKSIYDDYDETKIDSKEHVVNQAIRYLELVSKILPNFNYDLKRAEKLQLVNSLYEFPNKISNEILSNIDNNLNSTIDDLMEYCRIKNLKLTKEEIVDELQKSAKYFMLNLFDFVARLSTTSKTIEILDKQDLKTVNYKLLNVMMHENLGKFSDFASKADELYDNTKNRMVKSMVCSVVRKHFLCNKNLKQVGNVQRVADKYFGNNRKYLK